MRPYCVMVKQAQATSLRKASDSPRSSAGLHIGLPGFCFWAFGSCAPSPNGPRPYVSPQQGLPLTAEASCFLSHLPFHPVLSSQTAA